MMNDLLQLSAIVILLKTVWNTNPIKNIKTFIFYKNIRISRGVVALLMTVTATVVGSRLNLLLLFPRSSIRMWRWDPPQHGISQYFPLLTLLYTYIVSVRRINAPYKFYYNSYLVWMVPFYFDIESFLRCIMF